MFPRDLLRVPLSKEMQFLPPRGVERKDLAVIHGQEISFNLLFFHDY